MKKFFLIVAVAMLSVVAFAQTEEQVEMQEQETSFYANKFGDNWYIGVEGSLASKTTHQAVLKNINPALGIRFGKWFTPYFGMSMEGQALFGNKVMSQDYTDASAIKNFQLNVLTQWNFTNMSGNYDPAHKFEVIGIVGLGWGHNFGNTIRRDQMLGTILNTLNNKLAIDFAYNFGADKQWQVYLEPSLIYCLAGAKSDHWHKNKNGEIVVDLDENGCGRSLVNWDINYSHLQLTAGLNYFFKTSNDTHRFREIATCDPSQFDALNAEINNLRAKNDADKSLIDNLRAEIDALKKALKDCEEKPAVVEKEVEPNLPAIFYQVNKSVITPAQAQNVAIAATVMKNHPEIKLMIKGYASPEGPHDNNDDLSIRRADAVKDMLVRKYNIDPSRIKTEGCGETDQLFEIYEFNRVAMLYIDK